MSEDPVDPKAGSDNEQSGTIQKQGTQDAPKNNTTDNDSSSSSSLEDISARKVAGESMTTFADFVNNNLIVVRSGVTATIILLTAYGFSNTPLFFRFRTVADIPSSYFVGRRKLYGRIISFNVHEPTQAIHLNIRHLSPIGQILPKSWYDFFIKFSPLSARIVKRRSKEKAEESASELLRVRLAGVQAPPIPRLYHRPEQWLERLAKQRSLIGLHLIGRQLPMTNDGHQAAVCAITYRPSWLQLFPTDVASSLVSDGSASVEDSLLSNGHETILEDSNTNETTTKIIDTSERMNDLQKDVQYMERLSRLEFEAAKNNQGMWSAPEVRDIKPEVFEELDFQKKANVLQKAWRWIRGG